MSQTPTRQADMTSAPGVLVALDFSDSIQALRFVDQVSPVDCGLKVGKELFTSAGPLLVRELVQRKFRVFLDLKFHDIPNTVARAVAAAADMGVWMVNVHASGGRRMMESARDALLPFGANRPVLTAVTVLTSFSESDLVDIGVNRPLTEQVAVLAKLAAESGMDGVVCSALEAPLLRQQCGEAFVLVTPGIRLAQNTLALGKDDQVRVITPREAIQQGSNYLVIGRPITSASDPVAVLRTINEDISYIK